MTQPMQQAPYQYAPPKKSHTLRNVLLILTLIFILFVGGCFALIGGVANEVDKAIDEEEANDTPTSVEAGAAFTHDEYTIDKGWKIGKDAFGTTITGLRATNEADERRSALLTFSFYKGTDVLGEVQCSSNELSSGESSKLDCIGDSAVPKNYEEIRVADAF